MQLNGSIVKNFSNTMFRQAKLKPVKKDSKWQMWLIARILGFMKVLDKEKFMRYYAVTFFGKCYLPFKPGVSTSDFSLIQQVLLITHECQHRYQQSREGFKFNARYLFSSAKRAMYEAEANTAAMEVYFYLTNKFLEPASLARKLKNYACTENDIKLVEKKLELAQKAVKLGGITTKSAKNATKLLPKEREQR